MRPDHLWGAETATPTAPKSTIERIQSLLELPQAPLEAGQLLTDGLVVTPGRELQRAQDLLLALVEGLLALLKLADGFGDASGTLLVRQQPLNRPLRPLQGLLLERVGEPHPHSLLVHEP